MASFHPRKAALKKQGLQDKGQAFVRESMWQTRLLGGNHGKSNRLGNGNWGLIGIIRGAAAQSIALAARQVQHVNLAVSVHQAVATWLSGKGKS